MSRKKKASFHLKYFNRINKKDKKNHVAFIQIFSYNKIGGKETENTILILKINK